MHDDFTHLTGFPTLARARRFLRGDTELTAHQREWLAGRLEDLEECLLMLQMWEQRSAVKNRQRKVR